MSPWRWPWHPGCRCGCSRVISARICRPECSEAVRRRSQPEVLSQFRGSWMSLMSVRRPSTTRTCAAPQSTGSGATLARSSLETDSALTPSTFPAAVIIASCVCPYTHLAQRKPREIRAVRRAWSQARASRWPPPLALATRRTATETGRDPVSPGSRYGSLAVGGSLIFRSRTTRPPYRRGVVTPRAATGGHSGQARPTR